MVKSWSAIACAASMIPYLMAQNQPRLRRVEGMPASDVRGNLPGFRPLQVGEANLFDVGSPPEHTRVAARLVVASGRPTEVQLLEGIRPFTKPVLDAIQQWRF